jgi:2-dehydro-3-deoxyphosphogluconate aldolase / (4S)-4-hydroxy-2-oxoglutarate aldolase
MARYPRLEVLNRMVEVGLVPVFYHGDIEVASQVVAACAAGGVTIFEFTNRGDHAIDVFAALERRVAQQTPGLILGAGSIVDEATAALFVAHGANFIVGPSFNERVARFCNRRKIAYLPGCATATEIGAAEEAGVEVVKLFPCELVGGPEFVKALLGPSPWTRIMPTGIRHVTKDGLAEWFKAGIVAAGIGRELLKKEFIDQRDYAALPRRAAEIRQWIQEARGR